MQPYKNSGNLSWISAFEIGEDYIKVQFIDGVVHLYTNGSVGTEHLQKMKELAMQGKGLNNYIDKQARNSYVKKYDDTLPEAK